MAALGSRGLSGLPKLLQSCFPVCFILLLLLLHLFFLLLFLLLLLLLLMFLHLLLLLLLIIILIFLVVLLLLLPKCFLWGGHRFLLKCGVLKVINMGW